MATATLPSYVPALRMKAGELAVLRNLAPDVADRVLPRVIVPPLEERDDTLQAQLFKVEDDPNIADVLAAHWRRRSVLVEATHLLPDLGRETVGRWMPKMFERARRVGVPAIPLVALADLTTRCWVPGSRGAALTREGEDALWHQVFTAQPARRRGFEPSSKGRKRRPAPSPPATD
jgi:hypothetical protein